MRGLIQRVSQASVSVGGEEVDKIGRGIVLLLGVQKNDTTDQAKSLLHKILNYRIFNDDKKKMNFSLKDVQGDLLIVSQFTLVADTRKGLRPGFSMAATPVLAQELYHDFISLAKQQAVDTDMYIGAGIFAADMQVSLTNDGPVTFALEC